MSAGVARQYTGTAGRIENAQVGVFLAYVTPDGSRALIDRELYLPEKWAGDRDRCRAAGIGDDVAFATKPELARKMIERAVRDEVYGGNPKLRQWLEEQEIPYVMAVACSEMITVAAGPRRAAGLAALVPRAGWQRLSCADGSKGPRLYDWALIGTDSPHRHLLVRRSLAPNEKGELELAFYRCYSPRAVSLAELVAVAGARWARARTASARRRTRPGWTTTRSASTAPGTGTSPCPSSRTRSSPSPPALCGRNSPNRLPPAGTPAASPLKGGYDGCGIFFATKNIPPAAIHNGQNRARPDPAHFRRGPPPVQPSRPRHPAARIPPAVVRLAALPPGCRPQVPL